MELNKIQNELGYERISGADSDIQIHAAYTSDLLSDVMGNAPGDSLLITIQAHKNTIAVATLADMKGIVLCNSRKAPQDMLEAAENENIVIFQTEDDQFTASWKIKKLLDN